MRSPSGFDFNKIVADYDRWFLTPMGRYYDYAEKREIRLALKKTSGSGLLEIGCGTGHWSSYFRELGLSALGVDVSIEMLKKAVGKEIPGAGFVCSDAHDLPLRDGAFDIALFITSLEFMNRPEQAIKEAVRCIRKPGGHLIVCTLNAESRLNRRRLKEMKKTYSKATMLSADKLHTMLSPYGRPSVHACVFSLNPFCPIPVVDPLVDLFARLLGLMSGDIIIGVVRL